MNDDRRDENGSIQPLMLSELIAVAREALAEHGDMMVWITAQTMDNECNYEHTGPVRFEPSVDVHRLWENWWPERKDQPVFMINGDAI